MKKHCNWFVNTPLAFVTAAVLTTAPPCRADDGCGQAEVYYQRAVEAPSAARRLEHLRQVLELCPTFAAWYQTGRTYLELGQSEAAVRAFRQAYDKAAGAREEGLALGRQGEAYLAGQRLEKAVSAVEIAVERFAGSAPPVWLTDLRRTLDQRLADGVMPAASISEVLASSRSFTSVPRVNVRVQFEFDSARLNDQGQRQVAELGKALAGYADQDFHVLVIGHTDTQGPADYNQGLSERRAATVAAVLQQQYPALAGSLTAQGKGESEPRYKGGSEEVHRLNRRVEVRLIKR